jgi:hypothetical protein
VLKALTGPKLTEDHKETANSAQLVSSVTKDKKTEELPALKRITAVWERHNTVLLVLMEITKLEKCLQINVINVPLATTALLVLQSQLPLGTTPHKRELLRLMPCTNAPQDFTALELETQFTKDAPVLLVTSARQELLSTSWRLTNARKERGVTESTFMMLHTAHLAHQVIAVPLDQTLLQVSPIVLSIVSAQ